MSSNPTLATAAFRLSTQQERAWTQQERGVQTFAQCVIGVAGPVDVARLRKALTDAVAKYEILRTVLRRQTGVKLPFQVIQEKAELHFEQGGEASDALLQRERESVSNVADGAVLRALLVASRPERHTLVLTLPAFCADVSTLKSLAAEIASAYGSGNDADSDVMQYADLVEWQNELLASDETRAGREFWRDGCRAIDFASLDSVTLPLERKSEAAFTLESVSLAGPAGLEASASALKTSGENILLAAWNALLFRITGQAELTLGCEFDGRRYAELESALGPLARTLPIRASLQADPPFKKLVEQVTAGTGEARNWQESFSWSQAGFAEAEAPVLPFAFTYQELDGATGAGDVKFELERVSVVSERYKLRLNAVRRGAGIELEFQYDASRLERASVERIAGYYRNLLTDAVANPETAVSKLPLLFENERKQLLVEWNATAAEFPAAKCLHELFEEQAARVPERVAVRCGEVAISYRELNERANQLAYYLRKHGVGPDRPVGLCLERSAETMVAVLAILKAGGAYVPLNPDNPAARLQQQLSGAAAVITESKLAAQISAAVGQDASIHVLVLDGDQALWASEPKTNPSANTNPENLVYVIYTSGSTGVPKGVAVRHRNLVNYADFITKRLELQKYPEGLQFATVSTLGADLGNTCIYPALISGGTLHIVAYETSTDPRQLAAYVSKHPVDVLKIVPSHLQALVQFGRRGEVAAAEVSDFRRRDADPEAAGKDRSVKAQLRSSEPLRANGNDGWVADVETQRLRLENHWINQHSDWASDSEHAGVRAGCQSGASASGSDWRTVHCGCGRDGGVSGAGGKDIREIHSESVCGRRRIEVRFRARSSHVSHGGPGAVWGGREH